MQTFNVDNKFTYTIYDPKTLIVETVQPYPHIRHIEYQLEPTDMTFGDNQPTRQLAWEKYNEILKAISIVKEYRMEFTILADIYTKKEKRIWSEIREKTVDGTSGQEESAEKVRIALRFFYNDLYRFLFQIEGNIESSPLYLRPHLLFQILTTLNTPTPSL